MELERMYVWGRKESVLFGVVACCWSAADARCVWPSRVGR